MNRFVFDFETLGENELNNLDWKIAVNINSYKNNKYFVKSFNGLNFAQSIKCSKCDNSAGTISKEKYMFYQFEYCYDENSGQNDIYCAECFNSNYNKSLSFEQALNPKREQPNPKSEHFSFVVFDQQICIKCKKTCDSFLFDQQWDFGSGCLTNIYIHCIDCKSKKNTTGHFHRTGITLENTVLPNLSQAFPVLISKKYLIFSVIENEIKEGCAMNPNNTFIAEIDTDNGLHITRSREIH